MRINQVKTFVDNALDYGVSGLNINDCRIGNEKRTYKGAGMSH
jgi:hypothetical protein